MKTTSLLGGLLVAQLVLAGALMLGRDAGTVEARPLLNFPASEVDRIVIDDNSNSSTLQLADGQWQLAEAGSLPANSSRISGLLDNLTALSTTWPVASTTASHERFEVAEDKFQRRLRLYQDEQLLGEYYFGTAPAFRQTHGRRADEDEVYALAINNFDLPGDSNDWLDKSLVSAGGPESIEGPDFALSRNGEQWQLADGPGSAALAEPDLKEVDALVSALANLRVLRVEDAPAGEVVQLAVSAEDGQWRYEFVQADSKYYVRRSDRPQSFTISQSDFERIAGKRRADLTASELPPLPETDASAEEQDLP